MRYLPAWLRMRSGCGLNLSCSTKSESSPGCTNPMVGLNSNMPADVHQSVSTKEDGLHPHMKVVVLTLWVCQHHCLHGWPWSSAPMLAYLPTL